jgi:DNA mismatch repair protein MutS2
MFSLKIVHGRGYGILRKLIIEHLRSVKFVKSFEHESEQLGGDGVTLVAIS